MSEQQKAGVVKIHGKEYKTVALRVQEFRAKHPNWSITTQILNNGADEIIIRAKILNAVGKVKSTGIAHEKKETSAINKTSYVENCETSAIGRALAAFGMAGTDEFASADEMSEATINQKINEVVKRQANHIKAAFMHYSSVMAIKQGIAEGDLATAAEEWFTLEEETKEHLWLSTSNGGVWTTREREVIKSTEFRQAHFGVAA